jgi:predicted dehydrogenase
MRKLRYGMVGGGQGAFIGAVHRHAMALDAHYDFMAGALSSDPERSKASGKSLGLEDSRNYGSWEAMLEGELKLPADQRIDVVSIVTPNHVHYPVAKAFAAAGFHVVCDKPLVHTSEQANDLLETVKHSGVVFGVTHNYTGYPMIRHAREMVRGGQLGTLRKVVVEYSQGWLATKLEDTDHKQAGWRSDPARSGIVGAVGDIGTHCENLVSSVTELSLEAICADLTSFVPGRILDDDANILLRFQGGAKGVLHCSQIQTGLENDLRLRVHGSEGSISWSQENPNYLDFYPLTGPRQLLARGNDYLCDAAKRASRLPSGHPEAFIEAFANVYVGVAEAIHAHLEGRALQPLEGDFPTLQDGARGVRFIEKTVESSKSAEKWTAM